LAMPQIDKLKVKHEALMDYMLANPTCTYRDVSAAFGVTIPWISCIVNSDVFREKLREKQGDLFEAGVLAPLENKMAAVVDLTLERLAEKVQHSESLPELTNTADKLLGRLGYGTKNGNGEGTSFTFNATLIERAQVLMGGKQANGSDSQQHIEGRAYPAPSLFDEEKSQRSEGGGSPLRSESAPSSGTEV
jgi:hypothetical protein